MSDVYHDCMASICAAARFQSALWFSGCEQRYWDRRFFWHCRAKMNGNTGWREPV